jgi:hypothetical protein
VGKAKKKYKVILKRNVRATLEPTVRIVGYVRMLVKSQHARKDRHDSDFSVVFAVSSATRRSQHQGYPYPL